jgi:cell division protein FtsB
MKLSELKLSKEKIREIVSKMAITKMRVFITILIIIVIWLAIWGNSQSASNSQAIKKFEEANKSLLAITAKNKELTASNQAQNVELTNLKATLKKFENDNAVLVKEVDKYKKELLQSKATA